MFRIRREQLEALGQLAFERFVRDAVAHVGETARFAPPSEEPSEPWVRARIARALSLGLREERVVLRFLEAAARFDEAFVERADVLALLASPERAANWPDTMRMLLLLWQARLPEGGPREGPEERV